ncbi:hypothetical protein [Streptomyces sp. NPDC056160]|uniref:hypothetical protein n=1 Tax=Streptomyces sp. NPDC056160 TaxID=3345731 RepID=UPI0035E0D47C
MSTPLTYKGHPVPYIAAWSSEIVPLPRVYPTPSGIAILGHARGSDGVLWHPTGLRPGGGVPQYGTVHGPRQRRAMRRLLCQVCGCPADRDERGWLWLLEDDRARPGWPEGQMTTHPPVCRPCATAAARLCPHLYSNVVAVRVGRPIADAVYGKEYRPGRTGVVPTESDVFHLNSPRLPWVLGGQLAISLLDTTVVDLAELAAEQDTVPAAP